MKTHSSDFRVAMFGAIVGTAVAFGVMLTRRLKKESAEWITVSALKERLTGKARPAVIDVRGPDEFIGPLGHIPDAINLPVGENSSN